MPRVTSQSSRAASTAVRTASAGSPGVGDHVVGGEGAHHRVGVAPLEQRGGEADRGHRVARARARRGSPRGELGQLPAPRRGARAGDHQEPVLDQGASRSWVSCSSERPLPVRSCRNFGAEDRDSGQSRVPAPPAGITAQNGRWPGHGRNALVRVTTFRRSSTRALRRPRPAAGDLLRRGDRRARRAVGDDVRQLGRQGRVAARRGARPRARHTLRVDLPAHWLGTVFLGRGLDGRAGGRRTPTSRTPWSAARTSWPLGGPGRRPPGARVLAAAAGRAVRRAAARRACTTSGSRSGRSRTRSSPYDPPADDDAATPRRRAPPTPSCGARPPPGLLTDGGRLLRRRTRLPHRGSPPSPSRSRAAAPWSWSLGPTGAARGDVRRRARHRPLPCRSDQGSGDLSRPGRRCPSRSPSAPASRTRSVDPGSR